MYNRSDKNFSASVFLWQLNLATETLKHRKKSNSLTDKRETH